MRDTNRFHIAAIAALLALIAVAAEAQLPTGTRYVAASKKATAPAFAAVDAAGKVTSLVPLAGAVAPVSIAMSARNHELIAWDHGQIHHYDVMNGVRTRTTHSVMNRISSALVDEDGGMVWCTDNGMLFKSSDTGCSALVTVAVLASHSFQAVGLDGATGDWIVSSYDGVAKDWRILYFDINGWVKQTITGMPSITGLAWSPWSNRMFGTYDSHGGGLVRIDPGGRVSTLALPASAARADLVGLGVRHQGSEGFLCAEAGASPQHLVLIGPNGSLTTVHASSGVLDPVGCTLFRSRILWATTKWSLGKQGLLSVDFGPSQGGKSYQIALSFGCRPGIAVPNVGAIHLRPDGLFFMSLAAGSPLFNGFSGVLDAQGRQLRSPFVNVPSDWGLLAIRVYGSAIAYDKTGITAISNSWSINIGWT